MNKVDINFKELASLQATLKTMQEVDIAEFLIKMEPEKRTIVMTMLPKDVLAEVFAELPRDLKTEVIESFTNPDLKDLIDELASDDLVDSLQELPSNMVTKLLHYVDSDRRDSINKLLNYPEDSVGSLMSVDYVAVKKSDSKSDVLKKISQSPADHEHLDSIFIKDDKRQIIGYFYLADLVRLQEESLDSIIQWNPVKVYTHDDQEKAAKLFNKHSLLSIPVCDKEDRIVGIITADDIFDVIADEIHEDYSLMQGMGTTESPYLETGVFSLASKRIVWLLVLMISATVTGFIIEKYQAVLSSTVALAAYIPMLMDSGGNSGSQSSTLIIRSMALDEIKEKDSLKVLWKELRVGLVVGSILALVNLVRMMLLSQVSINICVTVSLTLLMTIVMAKLVGGLLPVLARKLKQDPAVMAGPLVTTVVDAFALVIYFKIAQLLMGIG